LIALPDLNEPAILDALRTRAEAGVIYTNIGTILLAINPFKVGAPSHMKTHAREHTNRPQTDAARPPRRRDRARAPCVPPAEMRDRCAGWRMRRDDHPRAPHLATVT
jgi:hypothetical protein